MPRCCTHLACPLRSVFALTWLALAASQKGLRVNRALRATHSRRETNRFIADGRLMVNGVTAASPDIRLRTGDSVKLDGQPIAWEEADLEPHVYLKYMLSSNVNTTTTTSHHSHP